MRYMALNKGVSVRLPADVRTRLEKIATRSGLKAADLIRMAIEQYCDKVEEDGVLTIRVGGPEDRAAKSSDDDREPRSLAAEPRSRYPASRKSS
jgi:predicted DNA-binding protein